MKDITIIGEQHFIQEGDTVRVYRNDDWFIGEVKDVIKQYRGELVDGKASKVECDDMIVVIEPGVRAPKQGTFHFKQCRKLNAKGQEIF